MSKEVAVEVESWVEVFMGPISSVDLRQHPAFSFYCCRSWVFVLIRLIPERIWMNQSVFNRLHVFWASGCVRWGVFFGNAVAWVLAFIFGGYFFHSFLSPWLLTCCCAWLQEPKLQLVCCCSYSLCCVGQPNHMIGLAPRSSLYHWLLVLSVKTWKEWVLTLYQPCLIFLSKKKKLFCRSYFAGVMVLSSSSRCSLMILRSVQVGSGWAQVPLKSDLFFLKIDL